MAPRIFLQKALYSLDQTFKMDPYLSRGRHLPFTVIPSSFSSCHSLLPVLVGIVLADCDATNALVARPNEGEEVSICLEGAII